MFKKIAAAVIALGLMVTSAYAEKVFEYSVLYWSVNGYVGDGDRSCVVSTRFNNGAVINVNVFPRLDGSQYTTMTVYNPDWTETPKVVNESFDEVIVFRGRDTGNVALKGTFQIYGPRKVILRELSGDFSYYFIKAREMIVFPDTSDAIFVSLAGTQAVSNALDDCVATVKRY